MLTLHYIYLTQLITFCQHFNYNSTRKEKKVKGQQDSRFDNICNQMYSYRILFMNTIIYTCQIYSDMHTHAYTFCTHSSCIYHLTVILHIKIVWKDVFKRYMARLTIQYILRLNFHCTSLRKITEPKKLKTRGKPQ